MKQPHSMQINSKTMGAMKIEKPIEAKATIQAWKKSGLTIGFVPTMGALHSGHMALVQKAQSENDKVVVSIFVNPLQFNDKNDFENYPQTLLQDSEKLTDNGCHLIIHGSFTDFFPEAKTIDDVTPLTPGKIADELEGAHRPGHFAGVKTIVSRLFEISGDCRAYFGEKDYQQTKVIESIAVENGFPTIVVCPTIRDNNGLALSSRNARLSESDKLLASTLYKAMNEARTMHQKEPNKSVEDLIKLASAVINETSITIEYVAIKDDDDWYSNDTVMKKPRMLIAATLSGVRLIDNLALYKS